MKRYSTLTPILRAVSLQVCAVVGLCVGLVSECRADQIYYFAQITCAPEIEQFSVRPYFQYNGPTRFFKEHEDGLSLLAKKHGIYTTLGLRSAPFQCDLKGEGTKDVHIVVTGEGPNGKAPLEWELADLIVTVNDKEVAKIGMGVRDPFPTGYVSVQWDGLHFEMIICPLSGERETEDHQSIFAPADQGKCKVTRVK